MLTTFVGTVIWYNMQEGYGIIRPDDGIRKVSLDHRQIHHDAYNYISLEVGHRVSFTLEGCAARDVRII